MDRKADPRAGYRYLLDLSMVASRAELNGNLPPGSLLVPETLDRLLRAEPSPQLAQLLTEAAMPDNANAVEREELAINQARLRTIMDA